MVFAGAGDVLDDFAPVAAVEFGSAFAGGADESDGKTAIVCQGDDGGFAITRMAFDADLLRVDRLVGCEIIERAARSPGPGAEGSPIVCFAELAFVDEADDAFGESSAVVGLDAGGREDRVAPSLSRALALARWDRAEAPRRGAAGS